MVYRDLSMEMASNQFTEITRPAQPETEPEPTAEKPKPKKKVVKAALPKSK
jgi:hypothetical protein